MAELNGNPIGLSELQALALTNYGHFTSMRVEDGAVRGLPLHLARLARDCEAVFAAELDTDRVREFARRAAPSHGAGVIRVTVFDPDLDMGHIGNDAHPHVLVTARPAGILPLPPLRARSVEFTRQAPEIKSVGLFGSLQQRREAQRAGFDDALFIDNEAMISEGGTWNVGFIKGDQVIWPEAECLVGTTMELIKRAHDCTTVPVHLADVADFDGAFATNIAIGVRAIVGIDGFSLRASHPMIDLLHKKYMAIPGDQL